MTIDAHAHIWQLDRHAQLWIDPQNMEAINRDFWIDDLDAVQHRNAINGSYIVQTQNSMEETLDLLAVSNQLLIRGVIGWVDLEADVEQQLVELRETPNGRGLVGIRHLVHQDLDDLWLLRPNVAEGLEQLGAAGFPFDFVIRPEQLLTTAAAAAAHPTVMFVLDHLGKPPLSDRDLSEWRSGLAAIAALPNVVAKLSGLTIEDDWGNWSARTLAEPIGLALELFGPERLMWGSDWPLVNLTRGVGPWLEAAQELTDWLSIEERDAVFENTAIRIYGDPYA